MNALNVIGQNISNVNTNAYKATCYTFDEALYTTSRSGSDGSATLGGRNPAQIGYGCSIGTIDLDMSTKNYTPTGWGLDCMINGDGFFITGDKDKTIATQDDLKAAKLTRLGHLDFHDGYLVDGNGNVIFGYACTGQTNGKYTYNNVLTPLRFSELKVTAATATTPAQYEIVYPTSTNGVLTYGAGTQGGMPVLNTIRIDEKTGRITGITDEGDQLMVIGYVGMAKVDNPNGVTHVDGRYYQALEGSGNVHATIMGGVPEGMTATPTGTNFTVEDAGDTRLVSGGLESSGTDLAQEISNMVVIQRGYQANTRIVSVTDSMLEELVNMKR